MPLGHERINAREAHPHNMRADTNPSITFISVLEDLPNADQAKKILDALAAQFRPIMKNWGFGVNSLTEHEWNPTFAGRNWNAGEVIEIVLRRRDGSFAPYQFFLYVMCHELAHIRQMNHSNAFQKVNKQIREALSSLRAKGYYGDGFWSSGRSLQYANAAVPFSPDDEPTFTCGGASQKRHRRRRPQAAGPSKPRGESVKLGKTGRQSRALSIAPKPGARVSRRGAFPEGGGQTLNEDPAQSSFKRRTQAKGAISARAEAAEARLAAEKRAQAAAARAAASDSSPSDLKPPVKAEKQEQDASSGVLVLSDSDDEAGRTEDSDARGWETNSSLDRAELVKEDVKLEEGERRFLADDMRGWQAIVKEEQDAAEQRERENLRDDQDVADSGAETDGVGSGQVAPGKRQKTDSQQRQEPTAGHDAADLDALDLTPQERAWIEADRNLHADDPGHEQGGGRSESGVEQVGKNGRVAYMALSTVAYR